MSILSEDIKVAENDRCYFHINGITKSVTDWAQGYGFDDIQCLLAIQKNNLEQKEYILIQSNEVIYSSKKLEELGCHIDMIALAEGKQRK